MTGLTVNVPQGHRIRLWRVVQPGHPGDPLGDFALWVAGGAQTTQVTLDIGGEHRHAGIAECFGHPLQGDRFARPGSARDQAMTVRQSHGLGNRLPGKVGTDNEL